MGCAMPQHVSRIFWVAPLVSPGKPGTLSFPTLQGWCCVGVGGPRRVSGPHTAPPNRPHDYSADGFNDWAFMTTHSWDEDPSGEWVLEIENTSEANNYGTGCWRAGGGGLAWAST